MLTAVGRLWWWEVRFRDPAGGGEVVLANELRLPAGRPAQIALTSVQVIHSLWVPELGGKRDLVPGRTDHLVVTPLRAGVFRGECAEFWGAQHVKMALPVVVKPVDEFARWLAAQARPAVAATAERADAGTLAVRTHGCAACHTVGGVNGPLDRGPDLTHVASRLTLGAGVLPNEQGAVKRWLVSVQALKPGARMPSYAHLDGAALGALADYLERLQ